MTRLDDGDEQEKRPLIAVLREEDILPCWRETPIGELLRCHNLHMPPGKSAYRRAELL